MTDYPEYGLRLPDHLSMMAEINPVVLQAWSQSIPPGAEQIQIVGSQIMVSCEDCLHRDEESAGGQTVSRLGLSIVRDWYFCNKGHGQSSHVCRCQFNRICRDHSSINSAEGSMSKN